MTHSLCNPLDVSKRLRFDLPTGEGVPQGLRGWGVRLRGSRGKVPLVGSDKVRDVFFHAKHGLAKPKSLVEHVQMKFGIIFRPYTMSLANSHVILVIKKGFLAHGS
ncbi:hypothetical protein, partial [Bacillus cereus]|uniref:hypothetical protein n=1 Tax=Bacillus cereus TaxID=1396 RepID=UPI001F5BC0D9